MGRAEAHLYSHPIVSKVMSAVIADRSGGHDTVAKYNSNKHRIIKMAPNDVDAGNYNVVKDNILARAKTNRRFQGVVYYSSRRIL